MGDVLTRPERAAERALARRLRLKVVAAGGCEYCRHAVHGWGISACSAADRTFPRCMKTPGVEFEPDHEKLQGDSHGDAAIE
jgi:hypothetical protein